jgi:all-trans-nonaprenyl-diphosphate synthase
MLHHANLVVQVIKLISQVIADFANGEISQATALFDTTLTIEQYLEKSFFKTASLIASSCRSAAVFSDADEDIKQAMFDYGKHLGLAFQVRPHVYSA